LRSRAPALQRSALQTTTARATQPKTPSAIAKPTASPATNARRVRRSYRQLATGLHGATHSRRPPRSLRSDCDPPQHQPRNPPAPAPATLCDPICHSAIAVTPPAIPATTAPCNPATAPLNTLATRCSRSALPPHNRPTRAVRPHPHAPPPRPPAPPHAAATLSRSHPTQSGNRATSPAHPRARQTQSHHPPSSAPNLRSGTAALPPRHQTDRARTALRSTQAAANNLATHP